MRLVSCQLVSNHSSIFLSYAKSTIPPAWYCASNARRSTGASRSQTDYQVDRLRCPFGRRTRNPPGRDVFACLENQKVSWIDVSGLGDVELLRQLGRHFHIHPLALEDVLITGQRPKVDEYDRQLFILLQMVYEDDDQELIFE